MQLFRSSHSEWGGVPIKVLKVSSIFGFIKDVRSSLTWFTRDLWASRTTGQFWSRTKVYLSYRVPSRLQVPKHARWEVGGGGWWGRGVPGWGGCWWRGWLGRTWSRRGVAWAGRLGWEAGSRWSLQNLERIVMGCSRGRSAGRRRRKRRRRKSGTGRCGTGGGWGRRGSAWWGWRACCCWAVGGGFAAAVAAGAWQTWLLAAASAGWSGGWQLVALSPS